MQEVLTPKEVKEILEELRKIEERSKDLDQNNEEGFLDDEEN